MARGFSFRAQAALDLRRRECDHALRLMAQVEADLHSAERRLAEADRALEQARHSYAGVMQSSSASSEQPWYRSWIVRRDRERSGAMRAVAARREELATRRALYDAARQKLDALERLKEKAQGEWLAREAAAEQKEFDALATMRFVANRGETRDHIGQ